MGQVGNFMGMIGNFMGQVRNPLGQVGDKMEPLWDMNFKLKTVIYKSKQFVSLWSYINKGISGVKPLLWVDLHNHSCFRVNPWAQNLPGYLIGMFKSPTPMLRLAEFIDWGPGCIGQITQLVQDIYLKLFVKTGSWYRMVHHPGPLLAPPMVQT